MGSISYEASLTISEATKWTYQEKNVIESGLIVVENPMNKDYIWS